jgi:hypothetical protein
LEGTYAGASAVSNPIDAELVEQLIQHRSSLARPVVVVPERFDALAIRTEVIGAPGVGPE